MARKYVEIKSEPVYTLEDMKKWELIISEYGPDIPERLKYEKIIAQKREKLNEAVRN